MVHSLRMVAGVPRGMSTFQHGTGFVGAYERFNAAIRTKNLACNKNRQARLLTVIGPIEMTLGMPVGMPAVSFNISRSVRPSIS